ncbi:GNAT family N-acetyltransferase [Kitasatospora sp. NBC_01250]
MILRPIAGPQEVELFNRLPYVFNHEIAQDLADGHRRREWLWVALRGGQVLARIGWWCRGSQDDAPFLLDILDYAEGEQDTGRLLFETARAAVLPDGTAQVNYTRFAPADWRTDPVARRVVEGRTAIVAGGGARPFVERLRFEWRPGTPVPAPSGRLSFRPFEDTEELLTVMTEVLAGTLDAYSLLDLRTMTPRQAAEAHYEDELARYTSPREWWRLATLADGEPVGFVLPSQGGYHPIIAYVGVRPAHRGRGCIDELLAEGTRVLAAADAPRIRATTDVGNQPMAEAFLRAGYADYEREIHLTWD